MLHDRELSWMQFNKRVLEEAQDESVPLLQRLRFLGIFSNNRDEFLRVRVANLIRASAIKSKTDFTPSNASPRKLLALVNEQMKATQSVFRKTYKHILAELEGNGIYIVNEKQLNETQKPFCLRHFFSIVSVRLVPLMLRKSIEIPFLPDSRNYLAVKMSTQGTRSSRYAILEIPTSEHCPRFVVLPSSKKRTDVIFLDDIIRLYLDDIFFMFSYDEISAHSFKVIRDAELTLDDDVSKSMLQKMEQSIHLRKDGRPIRLIYDNEMPKDLLDTIAKKLKLRNQEQLEAGGRYHRMRDLMDFPKVATALENANPSALLHPAIKPFKSIIKVIKERDLFLFYPYQTFNHFIDLLREAAVDPRVESIYITLYRTAERSKVLNTLVNAAKNGKQVTVLIELKARFDEEQNIDNTEVLQSAGVKVLYSVEELKVHSKLLLIERREGANKRKGYVYVGTGNFNENTALIYSDFGVFTSHPAIAEDAKKVFDFLKSPHKQYVFKHLLVSPFYMRMEFEKLINNEIKNAKKGKNAYIYAKLNALTDEKMVHFLYKASQAGVKVKLIIRGACCLCPQLKGLSENIEVIRIVDKYLEHARLLICCNGGRPCSYIMSADWMTRNLDRRIEVAIPILDKKIHKILEDIFEIQWRDNVKSRSLSLDLDKAPTHSTAQSYRSQIELYNYFNSLQPHSLG
ncbi:MAG: polyphosphate kinase 1 [Proteobacteria bacterium]|nr:polyphosphate kinase 1 [Cystobacterineae bacterium]MCL2259314.1 polyphosphate kinase 1 [Cystobacterineae bacterium]MCL2314263.1 polyphosphate kinase 1 [Pseudomonadota bacterium]